MEKESKDNVLNEKNGKGGLIALLLIIIVGLLGYICYDNGLLNKLIKKDKIEPKVEEKLNEEEVLKLHDSLIWDDTGTTLYFDKKVNVYDNTEEVVNWLITKYADENNWAGILEDFYKRKLEKQTTEEEFNNVASVSKSQIETMLKDNFNVDKKLVLNDSSYYSYRAWSVKYTSSDDSFHLEAGTAGAEYGGIKAKLVKYDQNGDELIIYDKVVMCHVSQTFTCYDGPRYNKTFFITANQDSQIKKKDDLNSKNWTYDDIVDYDYVFNTYGDQLDTYKTIFKKASDGKYYWYSSEIEK